MNFKKKEYDFRGANKPQVDARVSGTVYIVDEKGKGFSYVRFRPAFVTALGWYMPKGISPDNPAFLKAIRFPSGAWKIFGLYVDDEHGVLLAEYPERPHWIRNIYRLPS